MRHVAPVLACVLCAGLVALVPTFDRGSASAHPGNEARITQLEQTVANQRRVIRTLRRPPSLFTVAETIQSWQPGAARYVLGVVYDNLRPLNGSETCGGGCR